METSVATTEGYKWGESDAPESGRHVKPFARLVAEDSDSETSKGALDLYHLKHARHIVSGNHDFAETPLEARLIDFLLKGRDDLSRYEVKVSYQGENSPRVDSALSYRTLKERFQVLQKWEGRVLSIDAARGEFTAILTDKTHPDVPEEQVTLNLEELSDTDIERLETGSLFFWNIGYRHTAAGNKSKESEIRLRRLRGFSNTAVEGARQFASEFKDLFNAMPGTTESHDR